MCGKVKTSSVLQCTEEVNCAFLAFQELGNTLREKLHKSFLYQLSLNRSVKLPFYQSNCFCIVYIYSKLEILFTFHLFKSLRTLKCSLIKNVLVKFIPPNCILFSHLYGSVRPFKFQVSSFKFQVYGFGKTFDDFTRFCWLYWQSKSFLNF